MQHFFSVLALWTSGSGPGQCSATTVVSQSPLPVATLQGPEWGLHNTCPETQTLLPAALVLFGVSAGIGLGRWLVLTPCWSLSCVEGPTGPAGLSTPVYSSQHGGGSR